MRLCDAYNNFSFTSNCAQERARAVREPRRHASFFPLSPVRLSSDSRACAVRIFLPIPPHCCRARGSCANLSVKTLVVPCRLNWLCCRRCRVRRRLQTSFELERQRVEPQRRLTAVIHPSAGAREMTARRGPQPGRDRWPRCPDGGRALISQSLERHAATRDPLGEALLPKHCDPICDGRGPFAHPRRMRALRGLPV